MNWRIINTNFNDAYNNMAIDEALTKSCKKNNSGIIRVYEWNPSAVSIGYFQNLEDEVDLKYCKKNNIDFVRRRTGGGAVYHDSAGEVTYSIIAPLSEFPKGITESYKLICGWLINGLKKVNVNAEFIPINDIIANGKKISGNAQTRRDGTLLQHGTILYKVDVDKMFSVLKVPNEKIKDKLISRVKERVSSIEKLSNCTKDELKEAIISGLSENKETEISNITSKEMTRAKELILERYKTKEWNEMR